MEIYLVRHPAVDAEGLCFGRTDVPLRPDWLSNLTAFRKMLPQPLPAIYSSPASRCLVVAGFLGGGKAQADERLAGLDFGTWEGKAWQALPPEELQTWFADMEQAVPHQGESGEDLLDRVAEFFDALIDTGQPALILADALWIRALLTIILGTDLAHAALFDIDHLTITRVDCREDNLTIAYTNRGVSATPAS